MPGQKASEEARREQILTAAYAVAARGGIDGLTVRAVAARAKLSHGLVLFHFRRKDELVTALLDRLLATTFLLTVSDDVLRLPDALDRFVAVIRQEMDRLSQEPRRMRLFFEYWALGSRHRGVRTKVSTALSRYRAAFRTFAEDAVQTHPARFAGVTPEGLAAIAVSLINGCAVQAMVDSEHFDIAEYRASAQRVMGHSGARVARRGPRVAAATLA
ncbi:MAG TPA: TetR/AcrR family transcriptional regulator [Gemmatimonadaceae bacterium]